MITLKRWTCQKYEKGKFDRLFLFVEKASSLEKESFSRDSIG